jgi:hypothetical protein
MRFGEVMADATPTDILYLSLVGVGICFAAIFVMSLVLQFVVALKARPARRAIWSVGPPALIVAAAAAYWGPQDGPWQIWLPVAAIFAGLLAFAYWYFTFRRAWIDDGSVPEGMRLSNDDWKIGLGFVVLVLAASFLRNVIELGF